jgi:hypothetical protein
MFRVELANSPESDTVSLTALRRHALHSCQLSNYTEHPSKVHHGARPQLAAPAAKPGRCYFSCFSLQSCVGPHCVSQCAGGTVAAPFGPQPAGYCAPVAFRTLTSSRSRNVRRRMGLCPLPASRARALDVSLSHVTSNVFYVKCARTSQRDHGLRPYQSSSCRRFCGRRMETWGSWAKGRALAVVTRSRQLAGLASNTSTQQLTRIARNTLTRHAIQARSQVHAEPERAGGSGAPPPWGCVCPIRSTGCRT